MISSSVLDILSLISCLDIQAEVLSRQVRKASGAQGSGRAGDVHVGGIDREVLLEALRLQKSPRTGAVTGWRPQGNKS